MLLLQQAHGVGEGCEGVHRVYGGGHLLVFCPLRVVVALLVPAARLRWKSFKPSRHSAPIAAPAAAKSPGGDRYDVQPDKSRAQN